MNSDSSLLLFVFKQFLHNNLTEQITDTIHGSFYILDAIQVLHIEVYLKVISRDFYKNLIIVSVLNSKRITV